MSLLILGVVLLVALVVGTSLFWSRFIYWRSRAWDADDVLDRAIAAEKALQQTVAEYMFWKQQIAQAVSRPAHIMMTEEQIMSIAQVVIAYIQQQTGQNPNQVN